MRRILTTAALLALPLATVVATPSTAQAAGTWQGCPYERVCIYPEGKGWNGGHPELILRNPTSIWAEPGASKSFNLSGMYNKHKIYVNDYYFTICPWLHTSLVWFKSGYNGTGTPVYGSYSGGSSADLNLTPVNSVLVSRGGWEMAGC